MTKEIVGKVIKGVGGLYFTRIVEDGKVIIVSSPAKGVLKRDDEKVLVGDNVRLRYNPENEGENVIAEILPRKNSLIRPPLANLDYLFITFATKKPVPVIETIDKLVAIAEHNDIIPVIVVTKSDIDETLAEEYVNIYRKIGIPAFSTSSLKDGGATELAEYIKLNIKDGKCAAFAGASGVGKSTLLNALFPSLALATGDISRKIERGRHTTRHVEIFDIENSPSAGQFADTPGFSLIDFARFDFFSLEELLPTFREFIPYIGKCRYADCAHVGESSAECAIALAAEKGEIPESRLASYRAIYKILAEKKDYE